MQKTSLLLLGSLMSWSLLVGMGACSDDPPRAGLADACLINTDCNAPLVCAFRKCHAACVTSRDCDPGQRCMASDRPYHVCQLADETGCTYNSNCPFSQVCGIDGQCRDQCVEDRDCVKEQVCFAGTCAEVGELKDGGLPVQASDAGSEASARGVPCNYTSQCPSPLVCRNQLCALECLTADDCAIGYDCADNRCVTGSGTLIGKEGGKVLAAGGKLELDVPAGALRAPISVVIAPLEAWPSGAFGQVFEIEPSGIQFATPATLTYTYEDAELGGALPSDLALGVAEGSTWMALASKVTPGEHKISASIAHLSVYGLVTGKATDGGSSGDASAAAAPTSTDARAPDGGGEAGDR